MTQEDRVLNHLMQGRTITPFQALNEYGSLRLGAIIYDLKHKGHNIINEWEHNQDTGKRYARYRLMPKDELF
ncbi:MAG: helix-turn-helix domain-containing protein [Gammaproteobacteria bacterium]|nr:helix-turn-helix domain-containing protein [Gammaproteobacteria bacterium]